MDGCATVRTPLIWVILVFMTSGDELNAVDVIHIRFGFPGKSFVSVIPSDSKEVSMDRTLFIISLGSFIFCKDMIKNRDSSAVEHVRYLASCESCMVLMGSLYGSVMVIGGGTRAPKSLYFW